MYFDRRAKRAGAQRRTSGGADACQTPPRSRRPADAEALIICDVVFCRDESVWIPRQSPLRAMPWAIVLQSCRRTMSSSAAVPKGPESGLETLINGWIIYSMMHRPKGPRRRACCHAESFCSRRPTPLSLAGLLIKMILVCPHLKQPTPVLEDVEHSCDSSGLAAASRGCIRRWALVPILAGQARYPGRLCL